MPLSIEGDQAEDVPLVAGEIAEVSPGERRRADANLSEVNVVAR
jgi:hypothetical protein